MQKTPIKHDFQTNIYLAPCEPGCRAMNLPACPPICSFVRDWRLLPELCGSRWVSGCMTSKTDEIAALYVAEHDRLERQISRRVGCRATACDLVHDIFLRIWERASDRWGSQSAYLSRCARNAAIDHVRAEQRRSEFFSGILPEQYAADIASPYDIVSARQDMGNIDQALAALPTRTRHIFLLNRIHGRSFSEIAAVLGISTRAVAKHMARAVAACEDVV